MVIVLCTFWEKSAGGYASLSERINKAYCEKHGYKWVCEHDRKLDPNEFAVQWEKVRLLNDLLQDTRHKAVVWIDADAVVFKSDTKIESFLNQERKASIIVSHDGINRSQDEDRDAKYVVSTGCMIIRNNPWSRAFLRNWIDDAGDFRKGKDRDKFVDMLRTDKMNAMSKSKVAVLPAKALNSEYESPDQNTFVWHAIKEDPEFRQNLFLRVLSNETEEPVKAAFKSRAKNSKDPKVGIVTLYDDAILPYAAFSDAANRIYAANKGFDFISVRSRLSDRDPQWDKVRAMDVLLNDVGMPYEYLVWIDADAVFKNTEVDLFEDIIKKHMDQGTEMLICDDSPNKGKLAPEGEVFANTGTFVLRNADWGKDFVRFWWANPMGLEKKVYHEQDVLGRLYKNNERSLKEKMKVLDYDVMNSAFGELPRNGRKGKDTFVLHMMKRSTPDRIAAFREVYEGHRKSSSRPLWTIDPPDVVPEHLQATDINKTPILIGVIVIAAALVLLLLAALRWNLFAKNSAPQQEINTKVN